MDIFPPSTKHLRRMYRCQRDSFDWCAKHHHVPKLFELRRQQVAQLKELLKQWEEADVLADPQRQKEKRRRDNARKALRDWQMERTAKAVSSC
jgi:hypothetical protein